MAESFDPRAAALQHAGAASGEASIVAGRMSEVVAEMANAVACGLVYVGDQLGRGRELRHRTSLPQPAASKLVRVVHGGPVTLELDGEKHMLQCGDSLRVPGLAVRMT